MFTHFRRMQLHVVPSRLSTKLTLVYNIPSIVPVKSNPQQQSIFNCNYPERQMVLYFLTSFYNVSLITLIQSKLETRSTRTHSPTSKHLRLLSSTSLRARVSLRVCAARRRSGRTGTQAHGVSVCTEQISDFLWSCQPGLAGEQLWSPISLPRPLPER